MRPDPILDAELNTHIGLHSLAEPTDREVASMMRFVQAEGGDENAWVQLCRVILNMNEFVYPD